MNRLPILAILIAALTLTGGLATGPLPANAAADERLSTAVACDAVACSTLNDSDQARLDGSDTQPGYAAFGHVTKNMELVRQIARMPGAGQMLNVPVKILRIRRLP